MILCSSDPFLVFHRGFGHPHPEDIQGRQRDAMHFRKEGENRGEVHTCMCTPHLLKTLYCASHMKSYELPFITNRVLAGFGWLPNCYWCQKPKTSEGWFILCRDSSGTALRGGKNNTQNPQIQWLSPLCVSQPPQQWESKEEGSTQPPTALLHCLPYRRELLAAAANTASPVFTLCAPQQLFTVIGQTWMSVLAQGLPHRCRLSLVYTVLTHPKS